MIAAQATSLKTAFARVACAPVPTPAVVVEIAPPHAASPYVATLIGACSEAVPKGDCVLASAGRDAQPPAPTAIVGWDGPEHRSVHIEVGLPRAGRAEWRARDLAFRAEDLEVERWRSVGLVIATLVGDASAEEPPSSVPPETTPAAIPRRPQSTPPPAPSPPEPAWIWLDVAGFVSPALDDGTWRGGASLRATHPFRSPPVVATAQIRYAARPADDAGLSVRWVAASLGVGAHLEVGEAVVVELRAELLAELVAASVTDPIAGTTDSGHRWIPGARAGVDAAWMLHRNLGVLVGLDASLLQSGTLVHLRDQRAGRAPPLSFAPILGVRVALP